MSEFCQLVNKMLYKKNENTHTHSVFKTVFTRKCFFFPNSAFKRLILSVKVHARKCKQFWVFYASTNTCLSMRMEICDGMTRKLVKYRDRRPCTKRSTRSSFQKRELLIVHQLVRKKKGGGTWTQRRKQQRQQ